MIIQCSLTTAYRVKKIQNYECHSFAKELTGENTAKFSFCFSNEEQRRNQDIKGTQ